MNVEPFHFRDAVRLNCPTGLSAATLREFRNAIDRLEPPVLHHHLRELPLRFTFTFWDYPNDFAVWAANALENHALAERLSVLDAFHERDLEALREQVAEAVEVALGEEGNTLPVSQGQEFYFSSSVAVTLDLGVEARTLGELVERLQEVPATSLYYHFFESRLRTPDGWDDISHWLLGAGHDAAARRIRNLDIYMASLESCRKVMVELLGKELA